MKTCLLVLLAVLLLSGCSDPAETLRRRAIKDYPEFWQQPEQIASVRKSHSIPPDYEFRSLELTGGVWDKEAHRGIYEWTFRFIKKSTGGGQNSRTNSGEFVSVVTAIKNPPIEFTAIDVTHVCYYDSDAVVPIAVKEVKTTRVGMKIKDHKVRFQGEEDYE